MKTTQIFIEPSAYGGKKKRVNAALFGSGKTDSGAASLICQSTLIGFAGVIRHASANLVCTSSINAKGAVTHKAKSSLFCTSVLNANSSVTYKAKSSLFCTSVLNAVASMTIPGAIANLICTSTLSAKASVFYEAKSSLTCTSILNAIGVSGEFGLANLVCTSTLTASGITGVFNVFENWESGSARWILGGTSNIVSTQSWSPTHSMTLTAGDPACFVTYHAAATNADVHINCYVYVTSPASTAWQGVVWRGSLSPLDTASNTFYYCYIKYTGSAGGLVFGKMVAGTQTDITTVSVANTFLTSKWINIDVRMIGNAINVQVQDPNTLNYLSSSGTMGATPTFAISTTDSSISTAGYFGIWQDPTGGFDFVYSDNFSLNYAFGTAALTCKSTITATGSKTLASKANLICNSTIIAKPALAHSANAQLVCNSIITANSKIKYNSSCELVCNSTITGNGNNSKEASCELICNSIIIGKQIIEHNGVADLICNSIILAHVSFQAQAELVCNSSIICGISKVIHKASSLLVCNSNITATGLVASQANLVCNSNINAKATCGYKSQAALQCSSYLRTTPGEAGVALLIANSILQASSRVSHNAGAALTCNSVLIGLANMLAQVKLITNSNINARGGITQPAHATLICNSQLNVNSKVVYRANAELISNSHMYHPFPGVIRHGTLTLQGTSNLSAKPRLIAGGKLRLIGNAILQSTGKVAHNTKANLICSSTIFALGNRTRHGMASLICSSNLTAKGIRKYNTSANLICNSQLIPKTVDYVNGSANLTCTSTFNASGKKTYHGKASLTCTSTLNGKMKVKFGARANLTCTSIFGARPGNFLICNSTLKGTGKVAHSSQADIICNSNITGRSGAKRPAFANLTCNSTLDAVGQSIAFVEAVLRGDANLTGTANVLHSSSVQLITNSELLGQQTVFGHFICRTQTQILLAIEAECISLGFEAGLTILHELPQFQNSRFGNTTTPNFLSAEVFALVVPSKVEEIPEWVQGGGRLTAGLRGYIHIDLYARSALDQVLTDPVKVDFLRTQTINLLQGLELFDPVDDFGTPILAMPMRLNLIDEPQVMGDAPEWCHSTLKLEYEFLECCSLDVENVIVDSDQAMGGIYGIVQSLVNNNVITQDQVFVSLTRNEQPLRIGPYLVAVAPGERIMHKPYQTGGGILTDCFYEYVNITIFGRVALDMAGFNTQTLTNPNDGIITLSDAIYNALELAYFVDNQGNTITFEQIRFISQREPNLYKHDRNFAYIEQTWEIPQFTYVSLNPNVIEGGAYLFTESGLVGDIGNIGVITTSLFEDFEDGGIGDCDGNLGTGLQPVTDRYISPTHSLSGNNGEELLQYCSPTNADLHLQAWVYVTSQGTDNPTWGGLFWRSPIDPVNDFDNYYYCYIQNSSTQSLQLGKILDGVQFVIVEIFSSVITDVWMQLDIRMVGENIQVICQDINGNTLSPDGDLIPIFVTCINVNDSDLSGIGYFGVIESNNEVLI